MVRLPVEFSTSMALVCYERVKVEFSMKAYGELEV
jgi:hypothetical protein